MQEPSKIIQPGECAGEYTQNWEKTFDKQFLIGWIAAFIILFGVTAIHKPQLFSDYSFWAFCLFKIFIISMISFLGGLLCRHYCRVDEKGYTYSNPDSWFKVNYTRKLQHFAAYLVPLITPFDHTKGVIPHLWESLLVLLTFLLMIEPIRTRIKFFMVQFNSMDRPEDRPNTLKWIVLGNILPGLILGTIFQQVFEELIHEPLLVLIVIFIVGIGDGLAEPIGIYFGKKQYTVPSWSLKSERRYVRTYVGSACVFISSLISVAIFYPEFNSQMQFITALIVLPPAMTLAEAFAPHSIDTPFLMIVGYGILTGICLFN